MEYLCGAYPDVSGFSPRNLRRMREFYRTYESAPEMLADAMTTGWTQNVIILEAELTLQERTWYIQAAHQFGWSKLELRHKIAANTHLENSLDFTDGICYTGRNSAREEVSPHAAAEDHQCHGTGSSSSADGFSAVLHLYYPEVFHLQMQTYITVHSFEYAQDKHGRSYGWGIARYAVTEDVLDAEVTQGAYGRSPEESKVRILQHLGMPCPGASDGDLAKLIR